VVFEGGLTSDWYDLQNQLSGFTRVCSYDRPGGPQSRSDPAPTPRTARDFVADLHAVLRAARVPGPYVVVGHSNSGLFSHEQPELVLDAIRDVVLAVRAGDPVPH
jgi:pimeloyl-ACP methyl ester carboxylesterase